MGIWSSNKKKYKKNKISFDDEMTLESYDGDLYDLERDEVFYSEDKDDVEEIEQDSDYTDFNKVEEYDSTEDDMYDKRLQLEKEESTTKSKSRKTSYKKTSSDEFYDSDLFYTISKWVKIIGIFLMIVCIAYYLSVGNFKSLIIYLISLVGAYFFGYGIMYVITNTKQ